MELGLKPYGIFYQGKRWNVFYVVGIALLYVFYIKARQVLR